MLVGLSSPSLVIKKDAVYALKNFTFCAKCEMIEDFYFKNPEVVSLIVSNIDEMFENIVTPSLSSLENMLYVFDKDKERTDPSGEEKNLVIEACRDLDMSVMQEKLND
jgi:hypothetical protein